MDRRSYVLYLAWTMPKESKSAPLAIAELELQQEGGATWRRVEIPLKVAQSLAILEIIHALLGIVRSPVMVTATQVASRLWIVWGILNVAPEATTARALVLLDLPRPLPTLSLSLQTLLFAWGITEIVRYSFFAFKEAGLQPFSLLWMRYSGFIVLYPLGVASELAMVVLAFPYLKKNRTWCLDMPNKFNFGFEYWIACLGIVAAYLPGFPQLYLYMLAQRKKVLRRGSGRAQPIAKAKKVE